jgi:predicted nucleic acid-binding protein
MRRKTAAGPVFDAWAELVRRGETRIVGAIRQKVLSGIRERERFERVRDRLSSFPDLLVNERHYERAAEFHNMCRAKGVQGSDADFLICAAAEAYNLPVFTTDKDFALYAHHLPVSIFEV